MADNASVLAEGACRVWRRQRLVWWIFAVNVILAFTSASSLSHRIGDVTDHSLASRRLVSGFDWGTYSELLSTPDVNFGSAVPGSASAILVFFVFMLFLEGGILATYANEYRLSTRDFFAHCGAFFWRFARLFLFMVVPVLAIVMGGRGLLHWGEKLISDAAGEKTGYIVSVASALLAAFLLLVVRLWFDMAQVRAVVEDERAIRISCARAFQLTVANFGSLFWMYIRLSLLAWLVFALALWFWIRVSGPGAIIMFELVLLIWVATRLWQRASEVVWYQRNVALPVSPTLPVAAPATESLPFRIAQEPITPTE